MNKVDNWLKDNKLRAYTTYTVLKRDQNVH